MRSGEVNRLKRDLKPDRNVIKNHISRGGIGLEYACAQKTEVRMHKNILKAAIFALLLVFSLQEVSSAALWWGAVAKRAVQKVREADEDGNSQKAEGNQYAGAQRDMNESARPLGRIKRRLLGNSSETESGE